MYPICGKLTVGSGEVLLFGVDGGAKEADSGPLSFFHKTNGYLSLPLEAGTPHLTMNTGAALALENCGPAASGAYFWVVRTPPTETMADVLSVPSPTLSGTAATGLGTPDGLSIYEFTSTGDLALTGGSSMAIYWMHCPDLGSGLVLGADLDANGAPAIPDGDLPLLYDEDITGGLQEGDLVNTYGRSSKVPVAKPGDSGSGDEPGGPSDSDSGSGPSLGATPPDVAAAPASDEAAAACVESMAAISDYISCRMCDVKGNCDDPFLSVIYGRRHGGERSGLAHRSRIGGLVGGLDFISKCSSGALIRYGLACSVSRSDGDISGPAAGHGKHTRHDALFANLFASYENFSDGNMKTNVGIMVGIGRGSTVASRLDSSDNYFRTKFSGTNFHAGLELVRNTFRLGMWQVGPYASVAYNHVRQNAHAEVTTATSGAISMPRTKFNFIDSTIGFNFELEIHHPCDGDRRIRLFARAGWHSLPFHAASKVTATRLTPSPDTFVPTFSHGVRNTLALSSGVRMKLSKHLELSTTLSAQIGKHFRNVNLNSSLGYSF
jgi:outer membrane autotransporter protein